MWSLETLHPRVGKEGQWVKSHNGLTNTYVFLKIQATLFVQIRSSIFERLFYLIAVL